MGARISSNERGFERVTYTAATAGRAILGATSKDGPGTACDGVLRGLTLGLGGL